MNDLQLVTEVTQPRVPGGGTGRGCRQGPRCEAWVLIPRPRRSQVFGEHLDSQPRGTALPKRRWLNSHLPPTRSPPHRGPRSLMPRDRARVGSREQTRHLPLASGLASENGSRLPATSSHSQGCILPGPRAPPSQKNPHFLSPPGEPLKGQPWPLLPDGWEIGRRAPFVTRLGRCPQIGGCAGPAVRVDLQLEKYSSSLETSVPSQPPPPRTAVGTSLIV